MGFFDKPAHKFFTKEQGEQIIAAIKEAEEDTLGEIRVHLENRCHTKDAFNRACELYEILEMHKTEEHTGVLIYIAVKDHLFAIYGDPKIDEVVPAYFWEHLIVAMETHFRQKRFLEGVLQCVEEVGLQFTEHFSTDNRSQNELPDDISFG